MPYFVGVDIGTGSARAAVVDEKGNVVGLNVQPIQLWQPSHKVFQQSSADVWTQACVAVKQAVKEAQVDPSEIKGVGFDATCSLVVLDKYDNPLSVDEGSNFTANNKNIILWADHRAEKQANLINDTKHPLLNYVGKTISLEMEVPKVLWLKQNMPVETWNKTGHFFDLPDFLTFRATGSKARSTCSLCCKFSYVPPGVENSKGWQDDFFEAIGLGEFVKNKHAKIGGIPGENGTVLEGGEPVANGLTAVAAAEMGLLPGTPVASAMIDAYAGAVATLGASSDAEREAMKGTDSHLSMLECGAKRLAIIGGTSSCHIPLAPNPIFVPGVWGPYNSVLIPGMWCAEGGQSCSGQLIDHILSTHPHHAEAQALAESKGTNIYALLNKHLDLMCDEAELTFLPELTKDMHIYPDFHGNRSPVADPTLTGIIVGMTLDTGLSDLACKYYAALTAIACQTRHIIDCMNREGYTIDTLVLSGGLCKNPLFVSLHADITRCTVVLPQNLEAAVVVGAAILGAKASGHFGGARMVDGRDQSLWDVMVAMGQAGQTVLPTEEKIVVDLHERRYNVFRAMLDDQRKYKAMMHV